MNQWCQSLEARFRDSLDKSFKDPKNRRDPADYVDTIVLNSKNAGGASAEAAQVLLAYEDLDGEVGRDLPRPTDMSTVIGLLGE